ncbi:hypothetical protein [Thalassospira marina]|uniref:Uncharacterized protein n=1 Tax=Thalassospira marina TaxID=2048283 RepID=A0A2N3KEB4_9PROT|nr:hypothetical protein [Thalassospira marina]AUG52703.1 hypothetical protein CSC3H3_08265 [Thalassospira marina]PKR48899.1 hypothetical protein COO20_23325 [Thalassospira marina]
MRVIKILVAVMAVLILIGIALVVYGLQRDKAAKQAENAATQTMTVQPEPPISDGMDNAGTPLSTDSEYEEPLDEPFGTINVDLAADETLLSFKVDGDRAFLHLTGPKGARIVVVSMTDKSVLGQILLMKPN